MKRVNEFLLGRLQLVLQNAFFITVGNRRALLGCNECRCPLDIESQENSHQQNRLSLLSRWTLRCAK